MQVWTKESSQGTVELRFSGSHISIRVGGESRGGTGLIVPLTPELRGSLYRNAPARNSAGEEITHAVGPVLLTEREAAAAIALHEEETRREEEERRAKELARWAGELDEAQRTGKPVQCGESWLDDCNDREEDCSTDVVSRHIYPDGTFRLHRRHTW